MTRRRLLATALAAVVAPGAAALLWYESRSPRDEISPGAMTADLAATYEFARGNQDLMHRLPCYCGCGSLGHQSLFDCFINDRGGNAAHAAGCRVCQDEAVDAERLLRKGTTGEGIRAWIDAAYGQLGPPTSTP